MPCAPVDIPVLEHALSLFVIQSEAKDLLLDSLCYPAAMERHEYDYFVYILASRSRQIYVGFTNSLSVRLKQHCEHRPGTFTAQYKIDRLVYYEHHQYVLNAIRREKVLKGWSRAKKIALIESSNPTWEGLSSKWGTSAFFVESPGSTGKVE